jgi:hypothetical protein
VSNELRSRVGQIRSGRLPSSSSGVHFSARLWLVLHDNLNRVDYTGDVAEDRQ